MSIYSICADIAQFRCDAVVLSTNAALTIDSIGMKALRTGGGEKLQKELQPFNRFTDGKARIVKNHRIKCDQVILAAVPTWKDGHSGECELLTDCCINSLKLALRNGNKKVAFELYDAELFGFPPEIAYNIQYEAIESYLESHDMTVFLVSSKRVQNDTVSGLRRFVDDYYDRPEPQVCYSIAPATAGGVVAFEAPAGAALGVVAGLTCIDSQSKPKKPVDKSLFTIPPELEKRLKMRDESYQQMLFRLIDERGLKDSECYKRANVSKQVFSKIRCNAEYRPTKPTLLAFAVALHLSFDETVELLQKAGYAFTQSSQFDIIVTYFIQKGCYDLFQINEFLYSYDQSLLGSC